MKETPFRERTGLTLPWIAALSAIIIIFYAWHRDVQRTEKMRLEIYGILEASQREILDEVVNVGSTETPELMFDPPASMHDQRIWTQHLLVKALKLDTKPPAGLPALRDQSALNKPTH